MTEGARLLAKTLDRFDLLRLFIRIADTGSLSAAGRSLNLSQPSASRQLRALEAELGTQLVTRSTHELTLTDAGLRFLGDARRLLGEWDTVRESFGLDRGELRGTLRVAAPRGLGQTVLADIAGRFVATHPGVALDWLLLDDPGDLAARAIDVWIRVGSIQDQSLIVRGLWQIERVLVAAANFPGRAAQPSEVAPLPAVVLNPYVGTKVDLAGPAGEIQTLTPRATISTDNIFVAERLTLAGLGYSILPLWLVQPALDDGRMRRLCAQWRPPVLDLAVAYPQSRFRPARVVAFVEHLRREIPKTGAGITALER